MFYSAAFSHFDTSNSELNKDWYQADGNVYTTTMKIDLLTKYYDDVLTFTYDYVILKDYTLIPINDVMTNRSQKYLNGFYLGRLDEKPVEFVE